MSVHTRINIGKQHPSSYTALVALSSAAEENAANSGLSPHLIELVKLRTSQINGCAFCIRLHSRDAAAKGETADRLAIVSAWRETTYFTPAERAALAIAERVTLIATRGGLDEEHNGSDPVLTEDQTAAVTWLSTVMNAFNRVAISSGYPVGP